MSEPNFWADWATSFQSELHAARQAVQDRVIAALKDFTDRLAQRPPLHALPAEERTQLDDAWQILQQESQRFHFQILPTDWSFHQQIWPRIEAVELVPVFRPDDPIGGLLRLKQVGLQDGEALIQPARITVSAGQAPVGFAELEQLLQSEPESEELAQHLKGWRQASLEGSLESIAVDFYLQFWQQPRSPEAVELLGQMMEETFQLKLLYPVRFQDHPPSWMEIVQSRMCTGRVREVLQPGLVDASGELRVPARVIVD